MLQIVHDYISRLEQTENVYLIYDQIIKQSHKL